MGRVTVPKEKAALPVMVAARPGVARGRPASSGKGQDQILPGKREALDSASCRPAPRRLVNT